MNGVNNRLGPFPPGFHRSGLVSSTTAKPGKATSRGAYRCVAAQNANSTDVQTYPQPQRPSTAHPTLCIELPMNTATMIHVIVLAGRLLRMLSCSSV